ncbi:38503_t:CDS:2, partial [Gigaspora margarita]
DIPRIINKIKTEDGIAKSVRTYLLQVPLPAFPLIVIALIPNNGSDTADSILQLHKQLIIEIVPLLACELAEFLNIMPIDNFFILNFPQVFVVIHEKEVSTNMDNEIINFTNDKQDENNEISVSTAITEAFCKMKHITTQNHNEEILSNNLFQDGSLQVNIVNRFIEDFSTLYNSDSVDLEFRYGLENNLDFELLLQQQQRHEAYTSRLLERNHIVAYFSNNENPEQRSVKQHEK